MALTSTDQLHNQELKIEQQKTEAALQKANMLESLMIASQREPNMESPEYRDKKINEKYKRINNPTRPTEGQLLGKSGEYLKDPETEEDISKPLQIKGMPPAIDPEEHKKAQKKQKIYNKAADPEAKGAEKEWLKRTGAQLPKFNIKPADLLKILQFLPALTGGGLQIASSRSLREHLKPGTKGLRPYDKSGGGRGISDEAWLKLIRSAPKV